jgi:type II secretory pathway component PulF
MTPDDVQEWSEHLAQLSAASVPLAAGFRAAAAESTNPRVANAMLTIAMEMEQGKPLAMILQESSRTLPSHVGGLVAAAARTGNLGRALADLVELQRSVRTTKRRIWDGFAYPVVVAILAGLLLLVLLFFSSSPFERLFAEFGMQLPFLTKLLFWWRNFGIWYLGGATLVLLISAWMYRTLRGEAAWLRFTSSFPLFGPLSHWLGLAEWSRLVAVLLNHHVPLPEALRLSAAGIRRQNLQQFSLALADGADRGQAISDLLARAPEYPRAMIPIVRWGEKNGLLAQAFELGSQMFQQRVENRSAVLQSALPPLMFIAIGCCVLLVAGGLFFPLGALLRTLSF